MEVHEVLSGAADYLDRYGWTHGTMFGPRIIPWVPPKACAVGAIGKAAMAYESDAFGRSTSVFTEWLGKGIERWNDAKGRTKEQVTSELRACAAVEKAKTETADVVQSPKGMALAQA